MLQSCLLGLTNLCGTNGSCQKVDGGHLVEIKAIFYKRNGWDNGTGMLPLLKLDTYWNTFLMVIDLVIDLWADFITTIKRAHERSDLDRSWLLSWHAGMCLLKFSIVFVPLNLYLRLHTIVFFNVLTNSTNKKKGRFCSWKHPLVHCEPGKMGRNCENLIG